jgi:hypothetical protein
MGHKKYTLQRRDDIQGSYLDDIPPDGRMIYTLRVIFGSDAPKRKRLAKRRGVLGRVGDQPLQQQQRTTMIARITIQEQLSSKRRQKQLFIRLPNLSGNVW